MDFTGRDISILISMSLAVILMTIIFNGMGITNEATNENEIPEFSLDSGNFDFAGQFPDNPGTSSTNFLTYKETNQGQAHVVWLNGDTSGGTQVFIDNTNTTENPEIEIQVSKWDSGNHVAEDNYIISEDNPTAIHDNNSYTIEFNWYEITDKGTNNVEVTVQYNIQEQPESGGGFLSRVPVIGGIMDAGSSIAAAVMWVGSVIYWIIAAAVTIIINAIAVIVDTVVFTIDLLSWVSTSYFDIVDHSSSFASIFLVIPGLLVFVEYLKLAFVVTDLIWLG